MLHKGENFKDNMPYIFVKDSENFIIPVSYAI